MPEYMTIEAARSTLHTSDFTLETWCKWYQSTMDGSSAAYREAWWLWNKIMLGK